MNISPGFLSQAREEVIQPQSNLGSYVPSSEPSESSVPTVSVEDNKEG